MNAGDNIFIAEMCDNWAILASKNGATRRENVKENGGNNISGNKFGGNQVGESRVAVNSKIQIYSMIIIIILRTISVKRIEIEINFQVWKSEW